MTLLVTNQNSDNKQTYIEKKQNIIK